MKQKGIAIVNKSVEIISTTDSDETRRRVDRVIKDHNRAKGSKFIPNTLLPSYYREPRKQTF